MMLTCLDLLKPFKQQYDVDMFGLIESFQTTIWCWHVWTYWSLSNNNMMLTCLDLLNHFKQQYDVDMFGLIKPFKQQYDVDMFGLIESFQTTIWCWHVWTYWSLSNNNMMLTTCLDLLKPFKQQYDVDMFGLIGSFQTTIWFGHVWIMRVNVKWKYFNQMMIFSSIVSPSIPFGPIKLLMSGTPFGPIKLLMLGTPFGPIKLLMLGTGVFSILQGILIYHGTISKIYLNIVAEIKLRCHEDLIVFTYPEHVKWRFCCIYEIIEKKYESIRRETHTVSAYVVT